MRGKHVVSALLLLIFAASWAYGQQATIEGQVFLHNSEYRTGKLEYVEGAYVSAPNATTQATNRKGIFELEFAGIDAGNTAVVSVEKGGLEPVNLSALQGVAIGREAPLRISMAKTGWLQQEQELLARRSIEALAAGHETLAAALAQGGAESRAAILGLENHFNRQIAARFEAEQLLDTQLEKLKNLLSAEAAQLARVNLDFASKRYREAYELYRRGAPREAVAILDEAALDKESEAALARLREWESKGKAKQAAEALNNLQQVVEAYQLNAQAHLLSFQYRDALNNQLKAVFLLETAGMGPNIQLADAYAAVALNYMLREEYGDALHYQEKRIKIQEHLLGDRAPEVAASCNRLAEICRGLNDYPMAQEALLRAISINEAALAGQHPELAVSYAGLAHTYQAMGAEEKALEAQQKAIGILEKTLAPNDPDIAGAYQRLADIHLDGGAYLDALKAQLKALFILEQSRQPGQPEALHAYNTLARIYLNLSDYDKALAVQQKILALQEKQLPPNHPQIADCYHNMASTLYFLQNLDGALEHEQQAYDILKEQLPPFHPRIQAVEASFAFLYTTRGERRQAEGHYLAAIEDLNRSLEFQPENPEAKKRIREMEAAQYTGQSNQDALAQRGAAKNVPAPQRASRAETGKEEPAKDLGFFQVTKATSLRERPTSSSSVLTRLAPGDKMKAIEKTEYYWWKVIYKGRTGYVKALLLEEVGQ